MVTFGAESVKVDGRWDRERGTKNANLMLQIKKKRMPWSDRFLPPAA
jgi:hypothetical protein